MLGEEVKVEVEVGIEVEVEVEVEIEVEVEVVEKDNGEAMTVLVEEEVVEMKVGCECLRTLITSPLCRWLSF
tara:strand:- start:577 stop:792 length:216 start_codon:yes stop_codon:yes gene_type:complete